MTQQEIEDRLSALEDAITSGELLVQYGDPPKKVRFRNMDELYMIRNDLEDQLNKILGVGKPLTRRYATRGQGWR